VNLAKIMAALEDKMSEVAKSAVERPADGDVFAYGRTVGTYAGLQVAKQLIDEMLRDELKRNGDL
jgi:hypothetical protein